MKHMLLAALVAWCLGCEDEGVPPVNTSSVRLAVEDASCTEAWLKISLTDPNEPRNIAIVQDGQRVSVSSLRSPDSVFVIEGLLPRHTYSFVAQRLRDSIAVGASIAVQLTTMDTTSHDFTWQIDTLGVTSSVLYDVAIINDTLAYAVGEMYLRDSTGQIDPLAWNAAKWNGQQWEPKRIPFIGACSAVLYPPIRAIWAFTANDILVTNGGSIVRYNGTSATIDCGMNSLLTGAINRIYAATPQDVYAVGNAGTVVHFNGSTWQRIESGTTLPIKDVYGARKNQSEQYEILGVAAANTPGDSKVFSIDNTMVRELQTGGLSSWSLGGIWFKPGRQYIVSGSGIWKSHLPEGTWALDDGLPGLFSRAIRGQEINDIVVCGDFWLMAHWNGGSWQTYFPGTSSSLGGVDIRGNLVIAVGFVGGRAVAIRGTR